MNEYFVKYKATYNRKFNDGLQHVKLEHSHFIICDPNHKAIISALDQIHRDKKETTPYEFSHIGESDIISVTKL